MNKIHGHEVIQLLFQISHDKTKSELIKEVQTAFGEDSRFYNCSAENMTAEDMITFFEGKGKIIFTDSGFELGTPGGCSH